MLVTPVSDPQTPKIPTRLEQAGALFSFSVQVVRKLADRTFRRQAPDQPAPRETSEVAVPAAEDLIASRMRDRESGQPAEQELVGLDLKATPLNRSYDVEPAEERADEIMDFIQFVVARLRPEGIMDRVARLYEKVRQLVPKPLRHYLPTSERPEPPVPPQPHLPPLRPKPPPLPNKVPNRKKELSQLAKRLLVNADAHLSKSEERFFAELGIYLEREGVHYLTPLTQDLPLTSEALLTTILENKGTKDRFIGRLEQIIGRIDWQRVRIDLAKELARQIGGIAQAISQLQESDLELGELLEQPGELKHAKRSYTATQGSEGDFNYLCKALDNEVRHFEDLFQKILGDRDPQDDTDRMIDALISHLGTKLVVQVVDLLSEKKMIESYFVQLLQLATAEAKENDAEDQPGAIEFEKEELVAWIQLISAFLAGPADFETAPELYNKVPRVREKFVDPTVTWVGQRFLIQEDSNLRLNLGIAAAALHELNLKYRKDAPQAKFKELIKIFNHRVLGNITGGRVFDEVIPELHKWCGDYNREVPRNLVLTAANIGLHAAVQPPPRD